jgi:NADPH:quinone reductase-like Zn-dependent oxidoreductase
MPSSHKALVLHSKDAGNFALEDRMTPVPGPGQLLIKICAAALNPVDILIQKQGFLVEYYGLPTVPGSDGSGTVEQLGEGVEGWVKGDRV